MEIYAIKGHQVKVTSKTANSGYPSDSDKVKKYLEIEKIYTVNYTDVHSSSTSVYLQEIPNIAFNSVNFESVTEQPEELNQAHKDYIKYNR
jgi:hypothetical protein